MALAHANRVATMGQLTASIAHEVNQPIAAAVTNAQAGLRWLSAQRPDLEEAKQAFRNIQENGKRAGDVIGRIRALIRKSPPRKDGIAINDAILEVVALTRGEAVKNGVSVRTQFAEGLPLIQGDRVQLQQVILNLIVNAVQAMSGAGEGARELLISTGTAEFGRRARRGAGFGSGVAFIQHRASLRRLLHHQIRWNGDGAVDLPFDHRGARRTIVGEREPAPRRRLSIRCACLRTEGNIRRAHCVRSCSVQGLACSRRILARGIVTSPRPLDRAAPLRNDARAQTRSGMAGAGPRQQRRCSRKSGSTRSR